MSWGCQKCFETIAITDDNEGGYPYQTDDGQWLCKSCYDAWTKERDLKMSNYIG